MFGKRANAGPGAVDEKPRAIPAAAAPEPRYTPAAAKAAAARPVQAPAPPPEPVRADEYYVTKSMVFGALIEAIDLSQLSRLDGESARSEIRDIVQEIIFRVPQAKGTPDEFGADVANHPDIVLEIALATEKVCDSDGPG